MRSLRSGPYEFESRKVRCWTAVLLACRAGGGTHATINIAARVLEGGSGAGNATSPDYGSHVFESCFVSFGCMLRNVAVGRSCFSTFWTPAAGTGEVYPRFVHHVNPVANEHHSTRVFCDIDASESLLKRVCQGVMGAPERLQGS